MSSIKDIQSMVAGQSVERLVATVKTAFMPNKGTGAKGPWTMQAAILADATGEIRAVFWNQSKDLRDLKGSVIVLVAADDYSMQADDHKNSKTGAIDRQLKVNNTVKLDEATLPGEVVAGQFAPAPPPLPGEIVSGQCASTQLGKPYYEDSKRESFERQKALELAVSLVIARGAASINDNEAVATAEIFCKFLSGDSTKVI